MTLADRIQQQFSEHATALLASSELLAAPLGAAAESMVAALSDDHKIIACANAPGDAECDRLVSSLLGRFERERLALPAISLSGGQDRHAFAAQSVPDFARQIEGLGRPGDVLLAVSSLGNCSNVFDAVITAHERGMQVIAITGGNGGVVAEALHHTDIHLALPSERAVIIDAMQHIVLNCLCDAIDWNFLGDEV